MSANAGIERIPSHAYIGRTWNWFHFGNPFDDGICKENEHGDCGKVVVVETSRYLQRSSSSVTSVPTTAESRDHRP